MLLYSKEHLEKETLAIIKSQLTQLVSNFKPQHEEYLTRDDVARILQVSKSTVSNWKKSGALAAYGIEGRVYYKRSDIEMAMIKIN